MIKTHQPHVTTEREMIGASLIIGPQLAGRCKCSRKACHGCERSLWLDSTQQCIIYVVRIWHTQLLPQLCTIMTHPMRVSCIAIHLKLVSTSFFKAGTASALPAAR